MFDASSLESHSICMSINPKRYKYTCENFKAVGLLPPTLFQSVRWNRGCNTGCVLAHITILKMCHLLKLPYVCIYEDDAYPRPDIKSVWNEILKNIPNNCGILKLGNSSYRGSHSVNNEHIWTMTSGTAYGSHAYLIRMELYPRLIQKMMDLNVPDVSMNLEYYSDLKYKPYVLSLESQLFIQKNINIDNIISRQGGQRYWYPNPSDLTGMTSGQPCKHFVDKLIDNELDYLEEMCVIRNKNWKKGKKSGVVLDKLIYTKDEDGRLQKISDNKWKIFWNNSDSVCDILKYDGEVNGIKFYTIL